MTGGPVPGLPDPPSAERRAIDRRYNEALTRLDRALRSLPPLPEAPAAYDGSQLGRVNNAWDILPGGAPALPPGWRGRLAGFVWQLLGPALQRQLTFNAALVDHLNRNARAHRETGAALIAVRDALDGLARLDSLLVQFLQQITPFVDTRERGLYDALRALHDAVDELRAIAVVAQRASVMARRELERVPGAAQAGAVPDAAPGPAPAAYASAADLGADIYVGFEDLFRGSEDEISGRLADYVPYFKGAADVLDVGCGRGELLELLKAGGVSARGIDVNTEMVEVCRARGLDAAGGDALGHLDGLPDESLGGLIAIQVIEHLPPDYLARLLRAACHKLRAGAPIVLETINPACWVAFFESYIRDLTHVRPIHPETLRYLLRASGFAEVEIVYRAPVAEDGRLRRVTPRPESFDKEAAGDPLVELVSAFNHNVDRLNERIFTYQDYAAVARRA